MAQRPSNPILKHIRSLAARRDSPPCDAELLRQFISDRDEGAFESLLRRHGQMVLRVARRTTGNETDAEDVFQATFLLLARRAAAIRKRESVASWLHGVAHRLALSLRSKHARRQQREKEAAAARAAESSPDSTWSKLEESLHELLAKLPEKYRTPLIYCYLEGWTQEEVARQLGKPLGTVRSWLARGREMLRRRLVRRGIYLSTEGAGAALLASSCATAEAVPPVLGMATLNAAHAFVGGNAMASIPPAVAALVQEGLRAMLVARLKHGTAYLLALALAVAASGSLAGLTRHANEAACGHEEAKPAVGEDRPRTDAFGDPLPPGAIARLGTIRFRREEGFPWKFSVSPDGQTLAAASGRSLIFWDMATGRPLRRFPFSQIIHHVAFAPDGKSIVIGGEDCIVYRIDPVSGKELQRLVGHQAVGDTVNIHSKGVGVAFNSDGKKLISFGSDKTVRVWEVRSGKELRRFSAKDFGSNDWSIRGISPDGKLVAISKHDSGQTLRLWDLEAAKEIQQQTYPNLVGAVAFSPDGKSLAVGYYATQAQPGRIALWSLANGKELRRSSELKGDVYVLAFSLDSKTLASTGADRAIRLWDAGLMKEIHATPPSDNPIHIVAFSPDGKTLISGGFANPIRLWDVATWRKRAMPEGAGQTITAVAYSPDGRLVASAWSNKIQLWVTTSGRRLRTFERQTGSVSALMFSVDGKSLIAGNLDGTVCVWDVASGKEQRRIVVGKGWVQRVVLSPDGKTLAVFGEATSRAIDLFDAGTGAKLRSLAIPSEQPGVIAIDVSLCFSPDGKTLYLGTGSNLSVLGWDMATGKALRLIGKHDGGLNGIALSCDGRSLAVVTMDGSLYLWEIATRQIRFITKEVGYATTVVYSVDGRYLALANTGNHQLLRRKEVIPSGVENREQVRIVRVADGKVVHRFTGHLGGINCLRFSADGRVLASGGLDTTVLLWDIAKLRKDDVRDRPPLTPEKFAELWRGLLGQATEAHGCMGTLIAASDKAVLLLGEKLKPIAAVDAERFAHLLKKLESDQFAEREEATRKLKKLGDSIEPALRKALQDKPPAESQRRLQAILDGLDGNERLRSLRAIEVLERIGDKPARALLRRLSEGAAGAWLTEEARTSLQRLEPHSK